MRRIATEALRSGATLFLAAVFILAAASEAGARVTRVVVDERQSPVYDGKGFGDVGAYERISGRVFGEIDPKDPHNAIITDLDLAPRNARGMVEYVATFTLFKPVDLSRASGVMIYSVPNRGNRFLPPAFSVGGDPGDGFFFRRGDVILLSGWQGDVVPRPGAETIVVPVAKNLDGSSVTGPFLVRFSDAPPFGSLTPGTKTMPLPPAHSAASLDTTKALLTKRLVEGGAIVPIPSSDWAFADCAEVPFPGAPNPNKISVKGGFDPAYLYELVYTAKDPLVLGIGLAATRDVVSFFKYSAKDETGTANPVAGRASHVVAQGISQSGNFIKTFIHLGFNVDESGRRVWDGANPHIAGRQVPLNLRFGFPGGAANMYEAGSEPALWWGSYADTARGRKTTSLLDRCQSTGTCPKIFETFGSAEFWGLRMSPGLVGTAADRDIPLPSNVRRYYFPGTTHGGGRGGFGATVAAPTGPCELPDNPNPETETMRALLIGLIDWVVKDTAPPPSRYPRLAEGQLVRPDRAAMGFPVIPGVPLPDGMLNSLLDYDFGQDLSYDDLSGRISKLPPPVKQAIPSLVPRVDADGNEVGGIPSVQFRVPLGTYLGWNVTRAGFAKGRLCGFTGGFVPFARTKAERVAAGDPRPSLEERYGTHEAYVAAVRAAAAELVAERFLLPEDATRLVAEAEASDVLKQRD